MPQTNEERLRSVHERAMRRFDDIQGVLFYERQQCLEDRRFYSLAGAQWEGPLGQDFENVPRLEMNKIHLSVIRIFNEYRNNRISVDFRPKTGRKGVPLADTLDGLYRADEQDSGAQEAYDNAFEEGVGGGFAAWRLRACYEDEYDPDNDHQRIRIEPIFDADTSVYFDLDAKRQDKSDAKYAFVVTSMMRHDYIETYNEDPASWPKTTDFQNFDWTTPDVVYIAEYYEIEDKGETIHIFKGLLGDELRIPHSELEEKLETLLATGFKEVGTRRIKKRKVHKYIMSGNDILKDDGFIAGTEIPVIPFYGKRWFIDNVERCMGHVRLSKDGQRLLNMQISRLAQIAALSPIEKPIFFPEQIAGHQEQWANDPIKQYPYQLINPMTDKDGNTVPAGPIGYTKPPAIPPAMGAIYQFLQVEMNAILGNQEQGEKLNANVSAKAVQLVQNKIDMQSFIYMDNFAKAMKRSGEVWLSMAKDTYVEEMREMKGVDERGMSSTITIMKPMIDKETSETVLENDISTANMDVIVDVGPSTQTRRDATVGALTGMLQLTADPEMQQVLSSVALMNMDGEGISDVQDWIRGKMVRKGVVKPTKEEEAQLTQEMQNMPPDPQAEYLKAAARQADSDAAKKQSETLLNNVKAENTHMSTLKLASDIDEQKVDTAIKIADAVSPLDSKN